MTDGFEVLVQDVIEAIATAPWNSSNSLPSLFVTCTCLRPLGVMAGESDAGNDSLLGLVHAGPATSGA